MNKSKLLYFLLDGLYGLHVFALVGVLISIPFGVSTFSGTEVSIGGWNLMHWLVAFSILIAYLIFLRGLYFLRQMARSMRVNEYFSTKLITSLKRSGDHFVTAGSILLGLMIGKWIYKLIDGKLVFAYNTDIFIPMFLAIVGLFFMIQSHTLQIAKHIKAENDLTI